MTPDPPVAGAAGRLTEASPLEIEPQELAALRSRPGAYALLDVREPWELEICGFPEAINLPLGALVGREQELPQDRPLVVLCHTGRRSLLASRHLRHLGWSGAVSLRGGVEAYALEVEPGMVRY